MNAIKEYYINKGKKHQIKFGSAHGGKWTFQVASKARPYILLTKVKGGLEVARRIAEAIHKSYNRHEQIDGTCRNTLERLIKCRTLADYKPINGSWDNPHQADGQTVEMVEPPNRFRKGKEPRWHLPSPGIGPEDLESPAQPLPVVPIEAEAVPA